VFAVRGTVLPQVLPRVGALTAFCLVLCLADDFAIRNYQVELPALDQLGHSVLGMALSMLIVFRTNSSNNRYWDARTLWGVITNASRNLARLGSVYAPPAEPLANLIIAYVVSVRETLRGKSTSPTLDHLLPAELSARVAVANNPPTLVAAEISRWIDRRRRDGRIDSYQAMAMEQSLSTMVDAQGGCERILRTPLPFVYAALIKQILLVYLITLPLVLVGKMGFAAPLAVAVVAFGMLGIEEAGIEIEVPFGTDPNSLPLDKICTTIALDTLALCAAEPAQS
jgi:putative membrane protein